MRILVKISVLLLISFLNTGVASAAHILPVRQDSSLIAAKQFNKKALDSLKAQKEFDYGPNDLKSASQSWWARLFRFIRDVFSNIWNFIFGNLGKVPHGGVILRYSLFVIALILLVYIIVKAAGIDPVRLFRNRPGKTALSFTENLEDINLINFDLEIDKAVEQRNYRLAVRLLYLKCLKQLSDIDLIKWEIDKTNVAYIYELKNPVQQSTFTALTRQFEYIWYGNFAVDQQQYGSISQLFQNFNKQLP